MKRRLPVLGSLVVLPLVAFLSAGTLLAAPGPDSNTATAILDAATLTALTALGDDTFSTTELNAVFTDPTQHYGPYMSTSPDSGTCGNDWATDTFDRHFTVRLTNTGTYLVYEQFKNGSFVSTGTPPGSPGGCDTDLGGMLRSGVSGGLHGYFLIPLPPAEVQTSNSPYCDAAAMTNANCTTTTFINTHFTPCYPFTCVVTTFFFHYAAGDQSLSLHDWKNASCDRGGNQGDIASTAGTPEKSPLCP